jgi:hypothetical protein
MAEPTPIVRSPPLVALAGWLVPGAGYWLIGQRSRGTTIGVTVVLLFASGLLVGGVRSLEVPGWDDRGNMIRLNSKGAKVSPDDAAYPRASWVMRGSALSEIRAKPWSIAQMLTGPVALAGSAWSIRAATDPDGDAGPRVARGVVSHGRVNEIGILYTAVAGMLNLLAMIDASSRAGQTEAK